jgi:predicted DNA-binding transcriptional regulator AlpA
MSRKKNAPAAPALVTTAPADHRPTVRRLLDKSVVTEVTGKSYVWIWNEMRAGRFPRSVAIGGSTKWYEDEIAAYIDGLPRRKLKPIEAA